MIASRWPAARHDRSGPYLTVHATLAPGQPITPRREAQPNGGRYLAV
jgi:hypothetical protein